MLYLQDLIENFENDVQQGLELLLHENGAIYVISHYKDGVRQGQYQAFYDNGNIELETQMKDGVFEGPYIRYHSNANIWQKGTFVNDQINNTRADLLRYVNPGEDKVSVSQDTFQFLHSMWQKETPVQELR